MWVGQRRFDLVVRLQDDRRDDASAIARAARSTATTARASRSASSRAIEETSAPGAIRREAGSRRIAVEASVAGRDLGGTAAEVRERLAARSTLPPGYFLDVGGRVESQERAPRALAVAHRRRARSPCSCCSTSRSARSPTCALILATLPDAFVGGIVALLARGRDLERLVAGRPDRPASASPCRTASCSSRRRARSSADGRPFAEALREASIGRVRPKLMTAATAILGLLPLLVLRLHGTEIERPLAIVMIGGLVTSTLFTLLALPAFLMWTEGRGGNRRGAEPDRTAWEG